MSDRQEALDQFASQKPLEGQVLAPAVITHAAPPALVHGAQLVLKPRVIKNVLQAINAEAQAGGPDWFYSIPFKNKRTGQTDYVEGPTIKLANAVAKLYGNCNIDPWCSSEGLDYWEFSARFIDLESGYAMTRLFRQRKDAAKIGGGDAGRNMEASYSIGVSKAIRNVIVNALTTYTDYAFQQARDSLVERVGKDIARYRKETAARISEMVDIRRVEAIIGRPAGEWLARDIAQVIGMGKAVKDGMANINEVFPPIEREDHGSTEGQLDEASGAGGIAQQPEEGEVAARSDAPPDKAKGVASAASPAAAAKADAASADAAPDVKYDPKLRKEAIAKMLAAASDDKLNKEQRLETVEVTATNWEELLEPNFFEALVKASISVAKGYTDAKEAKKTLETFK